jgi:dihydrofolate reductase
VVGGADVYAATIEHAQTLLITEVDAAPAGDAAFPAIDADLWRRAAVREATRLPEDAFAYRFVRWERSAATGATE